MNRRLLALWALLICIPAGTAAAADGKPLNVLFIAVDDLRPELACYGAKHIKSPNLDKLAASSTRFDRAYCQQAVCSPSRTSLMTGLRPDSTQVYDLQTHFRRRLPDVVTLAQHFKNNGYHAESMGKIYHGGLDDAASWSVPAWNASRGAGRRQAAGKKEPEAGDRQRAPTKQQQAAGNRKAAETSPEEQERLARQRQATRR